MLDLGTRMVLCACVGVVVVLLYRIQDALRRIALLLACIATGKTAVRLDRLTPEERQQLQRQATEPGKLS